MNENINQIFSVIFIVSCLSICAIVYILRTLLETLFVGTKTNKYYKKLVLPLLPFVVGLSLMKIENISITTALVASLLSSNVYAAIKTFIKNKSV